MVKKEEYFPEKRDIVWINFNTSKGHEQKGKSPALVISNTYYNKKVGLFLACPITSQAKGYPYEVEVKTKKIEGVILTDQIKSLDWKARNTTFIQKLSKRKFTVVIEKVLTLIKLD